MPKIALSCPNLRLRDELCRLMPESFSKDGAFKVSASPGLDKGFKALSKSDDALELEYASASDLLCALGDVLANDAPSPEEPPRVPRFAMRAVMLDCSRNGAPSVEFLKDALLRLSLLGLTHFCLYTEDTYEVEGEPLIGFARARYSKDEIRKLVSFAETLGVELFPCMQTLGHLEHIFKYPKYQPLMDNNRVVNVREPKSYEFLEKLIANVREPYKSSLIHLGTDEPWGIGRGKSLDFDKPLKPGALYAGHLKKIAELCEKSGLKGAVWGDYVLGHSGEKALSGEDADAMPKSLLMDYWSYSSTDKAEHLANISSYQALGYDVMVSPGLWNWNRFWGNTAFAMETMSPLLEAAAEKGVSKAMMTMWGDDGQESLFDSNWASLAFFLASCRVKEPSKAYYAARLSSVVGIPLERFELVSKMESPDLDRDGVVDKRVVIGKPLLYDDPLLCFANRCFQDDLPHKHFAAMDEELRALKTVSSRDRALNQLAFSYAKLVALKYKMQRQTRLAYLAKNRNALKKSLRNVADVRKALHKFRRLYLKAWLAERKSFGLEIIDVRLGGLEARLDSFTRTVRGFLAGETPSIPEFELQNPPELTIDRLPTYCSVSSKNHNALWI